MKINIILQFILLLLISNSCKSDKAVVITLPNDYWCPVRGHHNALDFRDEGLIRFYIDCWNGLDTAIIEDLWDFTKIDTASFTQSAFLKLNDDDKLSVTEIEKLLIRLGVKNIKLRETIHWATMLTYAYLIPSRNKFGDITGYYAMAKGEYIPPEYFSVDKESKIRQGDLYIGKIETPDLKNEISFELKIYGRGKNTDFQSIEKSRSLPAIEIEGIQASDGYNIFVLIRVRSTVYITKEGEIYNIFYFPEFFPYHTELIQ